MTEPQSSPANKTIKLKSRFLPPYWSRLDSYLFSEINYPFWLSMLIYNGIVFVHILSEVSETGGGAYDIPFRIFGLIFISRIPEFLQITMAISFLSGALFGLRRMSADSEIIAPQSLGVSFWRLNRAVFAYGLLITLAMFSIENYLAPRLTLQAQNEFNAFLETEASPNINEGINPLGRNGVLYVRGVEEGKLAGMTIINRSEAGGEDIYMARRASLYSTREVHLYDFFMCTLNEEGEHRLNVVAGKDYKLAIPVTADLKGKSFSVKPYELIDTQALYQQIQRGGDTIEARMLEYEYWRRLLMPFFFIILSLGPIPLAAKHSRLSSGGGTGISIFAIGIFFLLSKMTKDLAEEGRLTALLAVIAPLVLFAVIGLVLQIGKNLWWSQYWKKSQGQISHVINSNILKAFRFTKNQLTKLLPKASRSGGDGTQTFVFPSKIDLYTFKAFLSIYFAVQASFLMLFFLVEYVQLADSIRENAISSRAVFMYFLYKAPEVIDLTMFICLLIAILLQFTVMSRNLEIVAIRAGGGSMQRLCMPLIFCGFLISGMVYYMQNEILPNTNRMAQQTRDSIRNKRETMFTNHVWMSPDREHIINFAYFDWRENILLDVTRYRMVSSDDRVTELERQYWPVLAYDKIEESWTARDGGEGWDIVFGDRLVEKALPSQISVGRTFRLNLDIADLQQGKRKANQFSIQDLQNYIAALRKLGYEVGHYQTELYAKYAKPFVPLIMMLLAMPLGIQVGRRGTFYGVGIGFGAGLSFLAFFELFKEFGASGILNPLVAGWTVIVVFGSVALYRFINLE